MDFFVPKEMPDRPDGDARAEESRGYHRSRVLPGEGQQLSERFR